MNVETVYEELKSLRQTVACLIERIDTLEHPWKAKAEKAIVTDAATNDRADERRTRHEEVVRPLFDWIYEEGISPANASDMTMFVIVLRKTTPDPENPMKETVDMFTHSGWNWDKGMKLPEERVAAFCSPLGNAQRVKILKALAFKAKTATELTQEAGISSGQFYHHIQELLDAGFVETTERNLYASTHRGWQTLAVVLALVSQSQK